jgi:hypothetical protein
MQVPTLTNDKNIPALLTLFSPWVQNLRIHVWEVYFEHFFSHFSSVCAVAESMPLRVGTFVGAHFFTFLFACAGC